MTKEIEKLHDRRCYCIHRAQDLVAVAEAAGRELTSAEDEECTARLKEADKLELEIKHAQAMSKPAERITHFEQPTTNLQELDRMYPNTTVTNMEIPPAAATHQTWLSGDGRELRVLDHNQRLADLPLSPADQEYANADLSFGRYVRGLITGNWDGASDEHRLAQSGATATAGGNLVPSLLSNKIVDNARSLAVTVQAGAQTIEWTGSDQLTLAAVSTDPTFSATLENETITATDAAFTRLNFNPIKLAARVVISRELAADSVNFVALIENTLARTFAAELDRQLLQGDNAGELQGLDTHGSVAETDIAGNISWTNVATAMEAVKTANGKVVAMISHPAVEQDLSVLLINAEANHYARPPEMIKQIQTTLYSTNCAGTDLFIGDFSQLVIGMRSNLELAISEHVGFSEDQIQVRAVARVSSNILLANHIQRVVGITHP